MGIVVVLIAMGTNVKAQDLSGRVFAGGGALTRCEGCLTWWQVGGVKVPVAARASLAGDVSVLGAFAENSRDRSHYVSVARVKVASVEGQYIFSAALGHPHLFATGGFGMGVSRDVVTGGPVFGAGLAWPIQDRRGIRLEARDQLLCGFPTTHLVVVRLALVFR